jgi:tRNA(fMet)-specific endonuclease VapC
MKYCLDTNTLIYYFKGLGNVSMRLLANSPADVAVSAIVLFELEVGIAKSASPRKRKAQLDDFLSLINVLPFGFEEAKQAAEIRVRLEKQGNPIGPYDILIAATALAKSSTLVTHNVKEFGRIQGLKLEDWF